ncbi:putative bifunctional diguanylate cyclase/phosphodiesterase [Aestuariirhabdus litorea]|uniref:EAL domain-containing protein n=1 Tax=Aestuariirhabdus litorea TaxID=2528527 RepID=A0A3P3VJT9_9GAMM|nr:EAL domain-containing protein [Aestuariirhabdus litorea]RRJ82644.1 EAL domain-containing protein [Aestuariirhabdus litorea]RWW92805.1 EAL domain-containing protein [Endozoicomonadaceae bacterium GTF-13]
MIKPPHNASGRLSGRLALILVIITVLVMSLFGAARLYYAHQSFERDLMGRFTRISQRIASAVNPSVWEIYRRSSERAYSEEYAASVLDSELTDPYLIGIIVYGRFGHIYMGKTNLPEQGILAYQSDQRRSLQLAADRKLTAPIRNGSMTIGKVELFFDTRLHRQQLQEVLLVEIAQMAAISLLFILLLYFILGRALLRPLASLEIARRTFESMDEAITHVDGEGIIFDINPAFTEITGLSRQEVIGTPYHALISGGIFALSISEIKRLTAEGNSWSGEVYIRHRQKADFPAWLTITSVSGLEPGNECIVYVFQDISSKKQAERQLQKLAHFDTLTGLSNRRFFEDRIEFELKSARREMRSFGLLFIDLDEFKVVNDTLGHAAGDQLLKEVAQRFSSRIRDTDTLARLGGDEFTVIACGASDEGLAQLAVELIELAQQPVILSNQEFEVGASIGIARYPDDGESVSELVKHADTAMYQAKSLGRRCYSFYSRELDHQLQQRQLMKTRIQLAVRNHEFQLYFQPKVDLESLRIYGAEGLIRWFAGDGTLIPPDEFIPLAEESNLIQQIDRWVVEQAVITLEQWSTTHPDLELSINLSGRQLHDASLVDHIKALLLQHPIDPRKLQLEITESAVIGDLEGSVANLNALKALGCQLAMDDFGTGYSSLSYLKRLPVDTLKIDREFIRHMHQSEEDGSIVEVILLLAHTLDLKVVAEGIENEEQLSYLSKAGCQYGQGYLFAKAVDKASFERLCADSLCSLS